ncbi:Uncharacterized protein LOK49_LG04G01745 [Camellia lanceoleosa]|uniref:Uncharacterized protein n=1 Tax=Camellia lanceoleosa TaxID=1840588 RepID=A0ACC0HXJ7_9ERIC|nr:Uncharacterized protein LOK49_LG04G01745 [Camellia lanceoleosa]
MSFEEEEESFEHTLLVVREVAVYKIPPRTTKWLQVCGEWLHRQDLVRRLASASSRTAARSAKILLRSFARLPPRQQNLRRARARFVEVLRAQDRRQGKAS